MSAAPAAHGDPQAAPPADFPFTLEDALADLERTVAHMKANGGELPPDLRVTRLIGEPPFDVTVTVGNTIYRVGLGSDAGETPAEALRRAADQLEKAA